MITIKIKKPAEIKASVEQPKQISVTTPGLRVVLKEDEAEAFTNSELEQMLK